MAVTKQIRIPNKNPSPFISRPCENLVPSMDINGGYLYPPSTSHFLHQFQQQQNYPPLLPLPIPTPHHQSLPSLSRGVSCSPTPKKKNRGGRDHSVTPKKTKLKSPSLKTEQAKQVTKSLMISSTNQLSPDLNNFPKYVPKVLKKSVMFDIGEEFEKFSGSVFSLSPHPSSLPLPKFSVRPKLSCNAEASGVDTGATNNLRRLLRLR